MSLINIFAKNVKTCNQNNLINLGIRKFNTSLPFFKSKLNETPYPWKNYRNQNPKYQYTSKIQDSDLLEENKEALLEKRLELSHALNQERQQILKAQEWPRHEYIPLKTQRVGLIGYKLGMIPHWTKTGNRIYTTLYQVMDNVALNYIPPNDVERLFRNQRPYMKFSTDYPAFVTQHRWGLQFVGAIAADPAEFTAEYAGLFTKYGVIPRRKLARFLVSEDAALEPGTEMSIQHFRLGDYIDVAARSTNAGFQGAMVRHKFSGGPATHGNSKNHRRTGSIGHGRPVLRGQRMHGVMGNRMMTNRGVQIVRMDYKYNIIYLNGVTPGPVHSYAHLYDTWLRYRKEQMVTTPPMPTIYESDEGWIDWTEREDDDFADFIHKFDDASISYDEKS